MGMSLPLLSLLMKYITQHLIALSISVGSFKFLLRIDEYQEVKFLPCEFNNSPLFSNQMLFFRASNHVLLVKNKAK